MAKEIELKLKEGDIAPEFSAATNGGSKVSLADLRGKNVVLYFYPKDDTPGCTKEACAFRNYFGEFKKAGAVVLGVSTDPVKSHDKFAAKFKLPFALLADEDKKIVQAYGVWGEKTFMGRKYLGTHRVTFLIGPDGRIKKNLAECQTGRTRGRSSGGVVKTYRRAKNRRRHCEQNQGQKGFILRNPFFCGASRQWKTARARSVGAQRNAQDLRG